MSAPGWASLSEAERRVVALLAQGLTNPQIAKRLYLSPCTKLLTAPGLDRLRRPARLERVRELHDRLGVFGRFGQRRHDGIADHHTLADDGIAVDEDEVAHVGAIADEHVLVDERRITDGHEFADDRAGHGGEV